MTAESRSVLLNFQKAADFTTVFRHTANNRRNKTELFPEHVLTDVSYKETLEFNL